MIRQLTAAEAQKLYERLSPFLNVEKAGQSVMEDWGCYPPKRNGRNQLKDWPLHSWRGPSTSPLVLSWSPAPQRKPTFDQFLRAYKIKLADAGTEH